MKKLATLLTLVLAGCHGETQAANNDCSALSGPWPAASQDFENQVLAMVNTQRQLGATCGSAGTFPSKPGLTADPRLTCAARAHAQDMVTNNYFEHNSQDGETPFQRITDAGYTWSNAGENIAAGQTTPDEVMQSWMASEGHCSNIMGDYVNIGIGYVPSDWVQDFASP